MIEIKNAKSISIPHCSLPSTEHVSLSLQGFCNASSKAYAAIVYLFVHRWTFNLELAPWSGGFFERLIGLTKRCLKKTIGKSKMSYDELITTVVEIEAILNSRPLTYVSCEKNL